MAEDAYLRLYRELNASRFDSADANAAIEQLGAPASVIRGLARSRRHCWSTARADLRAALARRDVAPLVEFVAGVGLFVARDYDLAITTLARAAARGKPGITTLPSGIQYRVIEPGTGAKPTPASTVQMHSRGSVSTGQEFANTYAQANPTPATFKVGEFPIKGVQEVLKMMPTGARWA